MNSKQIYEMELGLTQETFLLSPPLSIHKMVTPDILSRPHIKVPCADLTKASTPVSSNSKA